MSNVEDIPELQNEYTRENYEWAARILMAFANSAGHFMVVLVGIIM